MHCKICHTLIIKKFSATLLKKYEVSYYQCPKCQFLQTEEPYWLEEAYSQSINTSDTGYMARNLFFSKKLTVLLFQLFKNRGKFLDYAGGYGVFVRLMRDNGFDFYWQDKYTQNLFAQGFEWRGQQPINAVTTFESFEHFVEPLVELENLLSISKTIIFSTELYPSSRPKPEDWWYFGLEHGQHISFYSLATFEYLAKTYQLNYHHDGSLHILTDKKLSTFQLKSMSFTKFGLDEIIKKSFLNSKTQTDYELAVLSQTNH